MNVDTGRIYRTEEAVKAAIARGENIVPVSKRVAAAVEAGMPLLTRRERRGLRDKRTEQRRRQSHA